MLRINPKIQIPLEEIELTYVRSSGPGGQNVNKVNSKAQLRWNVVASPSLPEPVRARFLAAHRTRVTQEGDVLLSSQRYRDQAKNTADVLDRLRSMVLDVAAPPKKRKPTKPSKASKERRLQGKRETSQKKQQRRKIERGE